MTESFVVSFREKWILIFEGDLAKGVGDFLLLKGEPDTFSKWANFVRNKYNTVVHAHNF